MDGQHSPTITSFVLRFIVEEPDDAANVPALCRGVIQHVQRDETLNFSDWQDAVEFIRQYVPIDTDAKRGKPCLKGVQPCE